MSTWNAVTVARAGRAGLAGVALAIVSASLAQATYGPRTTIGTNYQQWSDTQSRDTVNEVSCGSYDFCSILFQQVPQGKSLIVRHVSCRVLVDAGEVDAGELRFGYLRAYKGQTLQNRLTHLLPVNTSGNQWVVSSPVMHLLKSNERPFVGFFARRGADWSVACSITGQLVEP